MCDLKLKARTLSSTDSCGVALIAQRGEDLLFVLSIVSLNPSMTE